MKRMFWCAGILLLINTAVQAQIKSGKLKTKQAAKSQTVSTNKANDNAGNAIVNSASNVSLTSTTNYSAKAIKSVLSSPQTVYTVPDPILRKRDQRARGANIRFNNSGIVGMPKRAYGFANGHISLATTGAVTSGTQTGSGAVGTGTSLATFGRIGPSMNVNGKSAYAGINMWGNARNMMITGIDSSVRLTPLKNK